MAIFSSNFDFLASSRSSLAKKYQNYSPSQWLPKLHPESGEIADLQQSEQANEVFYGMDPHEACRMQVELFFRHPSHFSLKLENKTNKRIHQKLINHLNDAAHDLGYSLKGKPQYSNLLLLGSGLGLHIDLIMQRLPIRHIILVEPNDDMLFHFLNTVNLQQLCDKLQENGGKLSILQCSNENDFAAAMEQVLAQDLGYGFLSEVTLFRHYETPFFNDVFARFRQLRGRVLSAWGFFEDEFNGLRHSCSNFKRHGVLGQAMPAEPQQDLLGNTPVMIVGNGPSLDQNIQKLKQTQHRYLLVSCGTALAALLNNDIVPDIHVEMERSILTTEVQKDWLQSERLSNTLLLALSTVPPETTNCFAHALIFTKAKDLGGFIVTRTAQDSIAPLYYCNPTVTNFALAAMCRLGFSQIGLMGCDYGFRQTEQHHSSGSDYFNQNSQLANANFKKEFVAEDNFSQPIFTTRIFDLARKNIEALLRKHPECQVVNYSDGVRIVGAEYQTFNASSTEPKPKDANLNKQAVIQYLIHCQAAASAVNEHLDTNIKAGLQTPLTAVSRLNQLAQSDTAAEQGLLSLCALANWLEKKMGEDLSAVMLVGDLRYLTLLISSHLNRLKAAQVSQYWQFVKTEIGLACTQYNDQLFKLKNGEVCEV